MAAYAVSRTVAGPTTPIVIDLKAFKFGVGLLVTCTFGSGGSGSYNVEVTGDILENGLVNWNLHDVLKGLSASANSSLAYPCTAVRLNVINVVNGTINLAVVQPHS